MSTEDLARSGRRIKLGAIVGVLAAVGLVAASVKVLPELSIGAAGGRWETPLPVVVLGIIIGLTYGLLAVGVVLIYRTNRIINFAHGEIGAFGAAIFGLAVIRWHVPYWVAFVLALAACAVVAALAEIGVIRRLRRAPRLMSVVATLGVGQFLVLLASVLYNEAGVSTLYPEPTGLPTFKIGALLITPAYSAMLFLSPVAVVLLATFLKRSRYGLAIRGAAANPEVARMSGIFAARMSSLAWALAGVLSALTAILNQPSQGVTVGGTFGPSLLLRALVGAVLARMSNMGVALVAGIGLGVVEQLLLWNYSDPGLVTVVVLGIILVGLLVQRPREGREEEKGSWAAVQALRPIPEALRKLWLVRNLGRIVALIALIGAALVPFVITNTAAVRLTGMAGIAIVGLSVGLVTGLAGQLTLGQFALAALGGVASVYVSRKTGNYTLSFLYAGVAAALASLVVGLPALRIKGLLLTVTTLSFALMVPAWLLEQPWMLGVSAEVSRPVFFGYVLDTGKSYYVFALVLLVLMTLLAHNVRRGGFGRMLIGIRDNEDAARAFTVRATGTKTQAFLISGFMAGIGGALYLHSLSQASATAFPIETSIAAVVMTVVGGVSLLAGPLLGVLLVIGVPSFLPLDSAGLAATQFGLLLIILYLPGGLGGLVEPLRDRIVGWAGRRAGIDPEAENPAGEQVLTQTSSSEVEASLGLRRVVPVGERLLHVDDIHKSFGGVQAVDGVSLEVYAGETVGLIGPNGAGKTTTFELIGGFTALDAGTVLYEGRDVSWMNPEQRARLGLIRSFQDAALFPTMTVAEVVQLALERVAPTRVFASTLGLPGNEREKRDRAREIVSFMGLGAYRRKQVRELSTGTRRITELACLVALEPTLLLLDEPSSGIAQRETERLGELLSRLKAQFGMTLLIIEHDIPLIMGLSDRIIAMADGRVLVEGPPQVVREDQRVIDSYLGGSVAAIERSGVAQVGAG